MSCLEIIDIRFNQGNVEKLVEQYIFPLLEEGQLHLESSWVFRKSSMAHQTAYSTCIQVFLSWSEHVQKEKSRLGLMLVETLKDFSLIEHTVWEPCYSNDKLAEAI